MRHGAIQRACLGVIVATGLVAWVGCESSSEKAAVERRIKTVDSVEDMRQQLQDADGQISVTQTTLKRLSTQQAGDLRPTYDEFRKDIDRNQSILNKMSGKANAISRDTARHLNEWGYEARTLQSEDLQQQSLQRQEQLREEQDQVQKAINEFRGAYTHYIRQLEDISAYAAQDLTPQGVRRLSDQTSQSDETASNLRQQLVQLDRQLSQMATTWNMSIPLAEREGVEEAAPAGAEIKTREGDVDVKTREGDVDIKANEPAESPRQFD